LFTVREEGAHVAEEHLGPIAFALQRLGSDIANAPIQNTNELRILGSGANFALLTVFVPGLANTLLVQLIKLPITDRYSLYAVYREGNVTFDAIARFDIGDHAECFKDLLEAFVQSPNFENAVVRPIATEVERHFGD
jgi:hypothetical protein